MGQTETATISGLITDATGAVVGGAEVKLQSVRRGVLGSTTTNKAGIYLFASVQPGQYQLTVQKPGFKQVDLLGLIVNVQDHIEQNFRLRIGSVTESVTVEANGLNINTTDATVSTVVDRQFVENMPMNGRSFQTLIELTPGVVTNSPQSSSGDVGQFSVNGQRAESNYFTVDGVSANISPGSNAGFSSAATSGSLPTGTALGTTQTLVSVDALEEFRVQTSTYSAEYGRNPGGQFSFVTRSGTNAWHGSAFDYLRNDFFDANDWFNDRAGAKQSALRQNDFGGTLGGPILIPRIYDGKDRTFFFFSYEGLRLLLPQPVVPTFVPTLALRQQVPVALQPVLNAFPIANGADQGNGLAEFQNTYSNPNQIDSISIRLDHRLGSKVNLFFRFGDTPSFIGSRNVSNLASTVFTSSRVQTYTLGATGAFSDHISNEFRLNYSLSDGTQYAKFDTFGGAKPIDLRRLAGLNQNPYYSVDVGLGFFPDNASATEYNAVTAQRQWNLTDTVAWGVGAHYLKFGLDYRRLTPHLRPESPQEAVLYDSASSAVINTGDFSIASTNISAFPLYTNVSVFAGDEWRATSKLNLSMGLRWEINPAPGATNGVLPFTVQGAGNLSTMTLAPQGTPLWKTTYNNFAPRLGVAYAIGNIPGHETVVRGGIGVFFDTGNEYGSSGFGVLGFNATQLYCPFPFCNGPSASFPLTSAQLNVPVPNPPMPPYTNATIFAFDPRLQLPFTLQWNVSIERALGKQQALTVSYVGANGRRLLEGHELFVTPINQNFGVVFFEKNGLTSDYGALQVQFQRRLSRGVQALASYTWSHSIDYGSQNSALPYLRGNSDFDVRHNFSSALSWNVPGSSLKGIAVALLGHWGLDGRISARSGFPVTLNGNFVFDPGTGNEVPGGLNLVSGSPIYVHGPQYPGGRAVNMAAFSLPAAGQTGDAPRNFVRGFGASQVDLAVRREFPIHERLRLQFRTEAFNLFNQPNFGTIDAQYGSPTFGQATQMLNRSLGSLSPLYQLGGPRSLQFSLKLMF
jgi:hypothetical protein